MPRYSRDHVPAYRLYKRNGSAVVTLSGKDIYLGEYGSAASRELYSQLIAK